MVRPMQLEYVPKDNSWHTARRWRRPRHVEMIDNEENSKSDPSGIHTSPTIILREDLKITFHYIKIICLFFELHQF